MALVGKPEASVIIVLNLNSITVAENYDYDPQLRQSACMQHHIAFVQPCPHASLLFLTALCNIQHQTHACVSSLLGNPAVAAHQPPTPLALSGTYSQVEYCVSEAQSGYNGRLNSTARRCQDANLLV